MSESERKDIQKVETICAKHSAGKVQHVENCLNDICYTLLSMKGLHSGD